MSIRLRLALAGCVGLIGWAVVGCAHDRDVERELPVDRSMNYSQAAASYNARAIRLDRIWARGAVSLRWIDDQGKERYEQGNAHLQVVQPRSFSLSIHKLGEQFAWIGADDQRYWYFDLGESGVAYVGQHARMTSDKLHEFGIPMPPLELIDLLGIRPLPDVSSPDVTSTSVLRGKDGPVIELNAGASRWLYELDGKTSKPRAIRWQQLVEGDWIDALSSTLRNYIPVVLEGEPGFFPEIASSIEIEHHPSRTVLRLTLEDPTDSRIRDAAFDFERLVDSLRPGEVIDLDAQPQAASARQVSESSP